MNSSHTYPYQSITIISFRYNSTMTVLNVHFLFISFFWIGKLNYLCMNVTVMLCFTIRLICLFVSVLQRVTSEAQGRKDEAELKDASAVSCKRMQPRGTPWEVWRKSPSFCLDTVLSLLSLYTLWLHKWSFYTKDFYQHIPLTDTAIIVLVIINLKSIRQ